MSLEQQIEALTAALIANTQAVLGNDGNAQQANASTTLTTQAGAAPAAGVVPAQNAAAPASPPAAAQNAAVYHSNPAAQQQQQQQAAPAITLEQLQQEITAAYQQSTPARQSQIMATVQAYAPELTSVPAEQYANLINAVRALP